MAAPTSPTPTTVAERLVAEGKITANQLETARHQVQSEGNRLEDALIETGALTEADLLKVLATTFRTRFITTDKLARADIAPSTLAMVARKQAELLNVFPVVWEEAGGALSVVTADAHDPQIARQIQSGNPVIKEVKLYVARPRAVRAAIARHYGGDIYAFAHLDRKGIEQFQSIMNVFERNVLSEESLSTSIATNERRQERSFSERDINNAGRRTIQRAPSHGGTGVSSGSSSENYLETVTVLVSLLENSRGELRGHSTLAARIVRKLAERIGIPAVEIHALQVASLFHDIGKTGVYHLTALNVAEYEGHRTAAQKAVLTPVRMFEAVQLAPSSENAIRGMYERFDGQGFPDGTAGKDIPLGARLLSIADTYADLTQNTRNPFRKKLAPAEACDVLSRYKNKIFDPNLVDVFRTTMLGDDLRAKLLAERPLILLIDQDPEESTVLELRLLEQGFEVAIARNSDGAAQILQQGGVELVVSEVDFGADKPSGFELLAAQSGQGKSSEIPWIFLTRESGRESISRAFEMGAVDYMIKPIPHDVLIAKVRKSMDTRSTRAARGVNGSLSEMALPDIVQVLAQGRKTGSLRIRSKKGSGEIHFDAGQVVNALWGTLRGEDAFYQMCALNEGDFSVDPAFKPGARTIHSTVESLMLEGMRRMDEGET